MILCRSDRQYIKEFFLLVHWLSDGDVYARAVDTARLAHSVSLSTRKIVVACAIF